MSDGIKLDYCKKSIGSFSLSRMPTFVVCTLHLFYGLGLERQSGHLRTSSCFARRQMSRPPSQAVCRWWRLV